MCLRDKAFERTVGSITPSPPSLIRVCMRSLLHSLKVFLVNSLKFPETKL